MTSPKLHCSLLKERSSDRGLKPEFFQCRTAEQKKGTVATVPSALREFLSCGPERRNYAAVSADRETRGQDQRATDALKAAAKATALQRLAPGPLARRLYAYA